MLAGLPYYIIKAANRCDAPRPRSQWHRVSSRQECVHSYLRFCPPRKRAAPTVSGKIDEFSFLPPPAPSPLLPTPLFHHHSRINNTDFRSLRPPPDVGVPLYFAQSLPLCPVPNPPLRSCSILLLQEIRDSFSLPSSPCLSLSLSLRPLNHRIRLIPYDARGNFRKNITFPRTIRSIPREKYNLFPCSHSDYRRAFSIPLPR